MKCSLWYLAPSRDRYWLTIDGELVLLLNGLRSVEDKMMALQVFSPWGYFSYHLKRLVCSFRIFFLWFLNGHTYSTWATSSFKDQCSVNFFDGLTSGDGWKCQISCFFRRSNASNLMKLHCCEKLFCSHFQNANSSSTRCSTSLGPPRCLLFHPRIALDPDGIEQRAPVTFKQTNGSGPSMGPELPSEPIKQLGWAGYVSHSAWSHWNRCVICKWQRNLQ